MKRHIAIMTAALFLFLPANAEKAAKEFEPLPTFTWGIRAGFAASGTYVSKAYFNGQKIEEYTQDTQVGNFIALQCRVNSRRLFLQSGIGIGFNKSTFTLDTDNLTATPILQPSVSVSYELKSLMIPVQFGYHVVNQSPYCLSLFTGPRIRFVSDKYYKASFDDFAPYCLTEDPKNIIMSWTFGMSVQISRTFLDFEYDAGIGNMSNGISDTSGIHPAPNIQLQRRLGTISFSYGLMF